MEKLQILAYRKCGTCRKAIKWLEENGIEFEERAIIEENPSREELEKWHELSGLDIKKLFNTSGNLYKELKLKDKLADMSYDEKMDLLAENGMLVKRPVLVGDDFAFFGFKEEQWQEKLK